MYGVVSDEPEEGEDDNASVHSTDSVVDNDVSDEDFADKKGGTICLI